MAKYVVSSDTARLSQFVDCYKAVIRTELEPLEFETDT